MTVASVVALLAYAATAVRAQVIAGAAALPASAPTAAAPRGLEGGLLMLGWLAQGVAIAVHAAGLDLDPPGTRFGFAPALSLTVWLVLAVYAIESRVLPLPALQRVLALLGGASVALALAFPGELRAHAGSPWAPIHWVLGIASYGLFGVAVLHAALLRKAEQRLRLKPGAGARALPPQNAHGVFGLPLLRLEKLTFRFVEAGFVVLSATIVLGWWFATPWRWDHKAIFSLLSWAVFAGLLVGRHSRGWRGRQATRWLYVGAGLLLLAYVGSRFVLEVLLQRSALG
ncbi:cytochrome c biogenesis protein CcsA [Rivibacter subsaxonicus]